MGRAAGLKGLYFAATSDMNLVIMVSPGTLLAEAQIQCVSGAQLAWWDVETELCDAGRGNFGMVARQEERDGPTVAYPCTGTRGSSAKSGQL